MARTTEGISVSQNIETKKLLSRDHRALVKGEWPSLDLGDLRRRANKAANRNKTRTAYSEIAKPNVAQIQRWIDAFISRQIYPGAGFQAFRYEWKYIRLTLGLQERLLIEQVLYEYGKPWATLCTGFGPVRD